MHWSQSVAASLRQRGGLCLKATDKSLFKVACGLLLFDHRVWCTWSMPAGLFVKLRPCSVLGF